MSREKTSHLVYEASPKPPQRQKVEVTVEMDMPVDAQPGDPLYVSSDANHVGKYDTHYTKIKSIKKPN